MEKVNTKNIWPSIPCPNQKQLELIVWLVIRLILLPFGSDCFDCCDSIRFDSTRLDSIRFDSVVVVVVVVEVVGIMLHHNECLMICLVIV